MPHFIMPLSRSQKKEIIEDLESRLSRQKAVIFTNIQGLKVKDLTKLRKLLKEKGIDYKMVKKTLLKTAFKKTFPAAAPDNIGSFDPRNIEGEIAVAFGYKDEILPAKILYKFSIENENLKIAGGIIAQRFFAKEELISLAKLPSREELLAKLAGTIASSFVGFINVLQGNAKKLVYILSNIKS